MVLDGFPDHCCEDIEYMISLIGQLGSISNNEAIELERKVLALRPQGHPDRVPSCVKLAISLATRHIHTGDDAFLNEAILLEREALALYPQELPHRASVYGNLAISLRKRHERTGEDALLDEAIDLGREALALCHLGHPRRDASCGNLAVSLRTRYEHTGNVALLDEAIDLEREALALRPEGHPDRAISCVQLAISLKKRYHYTGDDALLDEAIILEREALALRLQEQSGYADICGHLANSLGLRYECTGDERLLHESLILLQRAQMFAPLHAVWRHLCGLSLLHLRQTSSFYDVRKSIQCLSRSLDYDLDDVAYAVLVFLHCMNEIWNQDAENQHSGLTNIYRRIISHLPFLANSALDVRPRLLALKGCSCIGSDAFISAALAEESMLGLELLELAQGVIWSQSLYLRDPQLEDVPDSLAEQLERHLQALAVRSTTEPCSSAQESALTLKDILHSHSSRAYALIREIRLHPGLERFMLGESCETLCATAANHPVVVLVGARSRYYALIIAPTQLDRHALLGLDLTTEDVKSLSYICTAKGARRCVIAPDIVQPKAKKAKFNKSAPSDSGPFDGQLKTLWHKVVKPVLDRLGLKASAHSPDNLSNIYTDDQCSDHRTSVHVCTGAPLVCSASSRYMQPVSMTEHARCAAVTLWCHHTHLL
jgi:tetratricopeptide (TPR) repeat protein